MRTTNALALVATCVAAMAVGAGLALRTPDDASPPPRAPTVAVAAPASTSGESPRLEAAASAPSVSSDAWGAGAQTGLDEMRTGFLQSPDLAQFFERGLRNPSSGGLFYARLAFRQCVVLGRASTSEASKKKPDALDSARARCGSLGDAVSRERLDGTLQTATARLDPALSIVDDLDTKTRHARLTPTDVRAAIDASIALGDPYLLRNVMLRGVPRLETFDGRPIAPDQRGDLMMATRLALCDLGVDCLREARTLLTCARPDGCADPLVAMGVGDASMSDDRRRALNELAVRLVAAARDGSLAGSFE